VIIGGLAELFSGAISMGLGAYLASDTERQKYDAEVLREQDEVQRFPAKERQECYEILEKYNISHDAITPVLDQLCADPKQWIQVRRIPPLEVQGKLMRSVHDGFRVET
jgi:hypothetical protein